MRVFTSPLPDVTIPDIALTEHVFRHADRLGDRTAIVDGPTGRSYTFTELLGAARKVAGGLVADGFEKGDTLAILSPNIPEYAIVFHGVALAGGTVTTLNPTYTVEEIAHQLVDSGARYLVTIELFLENARVAAEGTSVEQIFVIGDPAGARSFFELFLADPIASQVATPPTTLWSCLTRRARQGCPRGWS